MKIKIKNQPTKKNPKYPKYHSTLYNRANNWAQATRPKTIGSMNSLFRQYYKASGGRIYLPGWKQFMEANAIPAFRHAGRDIYKKFKQIQDSINSTTDKQHRENCEIYANDLMTTKTFNGFNIQAHIAKALSAKYSVPWEFSDEGGESKGIDIYLGDIPISIKKMIMINN